MRQFQIQKWISWKWYVRPTPRLELFLEQLPDIIQVPSRALQIIVEIQCYVFSCEADEGPICGFPAYEEGVVGKLLGIFVRYMLWLKTRNCGMEKGNWGGSRRMGGARIEERWKGEEMRD